MSAQALDHVFEQHGMGEAPYALIGVWSPPSQSLAEANPTAYNNAMREKPAVCCFFCDHCGTPITHHFVVRDANGTRFAIGSDCAEKAGDSRLVTATHKAKLKMQRKQARAKREAKREADRQAMLAELDAQRERNGGLTDAEVQQQERARQREAFEAKCAEIARPVLDVLTAQTNSPFCLDIASRLRAGFTPNGKARQIVIEIAAKQHGRKGSKAYESALDSIEPEFERIFDELDALRA